jgi:glycosyltransferase involved in cell wall biosynthesis
MDIICFANDWDGDPLSKQHIMRRLARAGARVLWVSSLGNRAPRLANAGDRKRIVGKAARFARSLWRGPRLVEPNVWVLDPLAIPIYGSRLATAANGALLSWHIRAAARRLGMHDPIHYTFIPASAWVAGRIDESLLYYHAAYEYAAFGGADRKAIGRLERTLLAKADLYIACSERLLYAKMADARRSLLLRHGVDHAHFSRAVEPGEAGLTIPDALAGLPRPVAGFFGLLAEWVDYEALAAVADRLAEGTLVLAGAARFPDGETGAAAQAFARLVARPNVRWLGRLPYQDLPALCRALDVALLPFTLDELTVHANPLKLREYLAAGLPVVASPIPEAAALAAELPHGAVTLAATPEAFAEAAVARARAADAGPRPERSAAVAGDSWDARVAQLATVLAGLAAPHLATKES